MIQDLRVWPTIVCTPCSHTSHGPFNVISISVEKPTPTTPVQRQSLTLKAGGMACKGCLRLLDVELVFSAPILI